MSIGRAFRHSAGLALLHLLATAAAASAFTFTVSPAGAISMASQGKLTFYAGGIAVECNITMTGTLAGGPIAASPGESFGSISNITARNCTGGSVERFLTPPWLVFYEGVGGTLPNAVSLIDVGIREVDLNYSVLGPIVNCLYRGNILSVVVLSGRNPYTTGSPQILSSTFGFVRGSRLCPASGEYEGGFTLSPQQTITFS